MHFHTESIYQVDSLDTSTSITSTYYQVLPSRQVPQDTSLGISVSSIACTTQKTFLQYQICTSTKPIYQVDRPALLQYTSLVTSIALKEILSTCITQ